MKSIYYLLLCLIFAQVLLGNVVEIYKKGEIKLIPEASFGKATEWDLLFTDTDKSIAFLADESFFRTASKGNKIYKFDASGKLEFSFGQAGQGPGDITNPNEISILDEKKLVVKERGNLRRISIFELDGNFTKLIRVDNFINSCIAVGNGMIGIVSTYQGPSGKDTMRKYDVYLKNVHSGKEVRLKSFERKNIQSRVQTPDLYGNVFILKIGLNNILVAFSESQEVNIFSDKGELVSKFNVDRNRRKINDKFFNHYLERVIDSQRSEREKTKLKQFIESNSDKISHPDYLPFYHKIAVDNEDNILIYLKNWEDASDVQFLVYSKTGDYLCKTKLNCLEYRPVYPTVFFENHIYTKLIPIDENKPSFLAKAKLK